MTFSSTQSSRHMRLGIAAVAVAALVAFGTAVGGCASLPENVDRPVSQALPPPADSPLARIAQAASGATADGQAARGASSGFLLLDGPQSAYGSRLALAEQARRTLDLQYYAIHADASTGRLMRAVQSAAQRGVRVRILIDDFHSAGRNALVLGLADTPNVQIRLFNPLAGARASSIGRILVSLGDAGRIQQRMHNKLFIADNAMGITGGRNLGDAYFGLGGDAGNFVDLDVLAVGPIVREMSKSFDQYWNDKRAYPVASLVSREEMDRIREKAAESRRSGQGGDGAAKPSPPDGEPRPDAASAAAFGDRRAAERPGWDEQPMDLAAQRFVRAPASLLVDQPAKIAADDQAKAEAAPAKPDAPRGEMPAGETVVEGLLPLIAQTRQDLVIVSPYFVPGAQIRSALAQARQRGVRIRVLTNSLASNDAPVAHVGYARHRTDLLDMGIELYEMRADEAGLRSALGAGSSGSLTGGMGESKAMLHSKFIVRDGRLLAIGSMNLDLRSQKQNTEIALLIRSTELSAEATAIVEKSLRQGAWKVERDPAANGALVWRAPAGSGLQDAHHEPDTRASLRALLWLIGPFAPDDML